jgi:hypothetical protein
MTKRGNPKLGKEGYCNLAGANRTCARCKAGKPPKKNRTLKDVKCNHCIGYNSNNYRS